MTVIYKSNLAVQFVVRQPVVEKNLQQGFTSTQRATQLIKPPVERFLLQTAPPKRTSFYYLSPQKLEKPANVSLGRHSTRVVMNKQTHTTASLGKRLFHFVMNGQAQTPASLGKRLFHFVMNGQAQTAQPPLTPSKLKSPPEEYQVTPITPSQLNSPSEENQVTSTTSSSSSSSFSFLSTKSQEKLTVECKQEDILTRSLWRAFSGSTYQIVFR